MLRPGPAACESLDDVDRLLGQLTLIGSLERDDAAELDRETAALKRSIQERQLVEVGKETLTYQDYRDRAVEAIRLYCESHRDEILAGEKGKTRRFTHGEVAFRKLPTKLIDLDGQAATTKARLLTAVKGVGKDGLVAAVCRWLRQFVVAPDVAADLVYRVEISPDRRSILELAQDGRLKPSWLKRFNLGLQDGGETIDVRPAEQLVQSEPTRRAA